MIKAFLNVWEDLKQASPGERFQRVYRHRRNSGHGITRKTLSLVLGVVLILAGVVLLFIPGPGLLIMAIGGVLIARRSLAAARILDRTELQLRKILFWAERRWRRSSA